MNKFSSYIYQLDSCLRHIDITLAAASGRLLKASSLPNLLLFLFHPVFKDKQEISKRVVSPFEKFTVANFRELIEFYLEQEYRFITVDEIPLIVSPDNLPSENKFVGITFDDGYYNNVQILPLLNEYKVPATFFIAYNHVAENRAYWWDVVSRNRAKQGKSHLATLKERNHLRSLTHDQIYSYLKNEFGPLAMEPFSDLDRPLTLDELAEFSRHKYVTIGNHTMDHARLTNYSNTQIVEQLQQAQASITQCIDTVPKSISYPDGAYTEQIVQLAIEAGLAVGVTTEPPNSDQQPEINNSTMLMGRLSLSGDLNIRHQCLALQSSLPRLSSLRQTLIAKYKQFA